MGDHTSAIVFGLIVGIETIGVGLVWAMCRVSARSDRRIERRLASEEEDRRIAHVRRKLEVP